MHAVLLPCESDTLLTGRRVVPGGWPESMLCCMPRGWCCLRIWAEAAQSWAAAFRGAAQDLREGCLTGGVQSLVATCTLHGGANMLNGSCSLSADPCHKEWAACTSAAAA